MLYNVGKLVCACVLFSCAPNLAAAVDGEVTLFKRLAMQVIFLWLCTELQAAVELEIRKKICEMLYISF